MKCWGCGLKWSPGMKKWWDTNYHSLLCYRTSKGITAAVDYSNGKDKTVEVEVQREGDVIKVLSIREVSDMELEEIAERGGRL